MSVVIKGNSALLAFDSSPAFYTGTLEFTGLKNGIFFLQQLQDVELSVSPASTQTKQLGSQGYGAQSINFSPDVLCNLSYLTRSDWSNDGLLGMFYRRNGVETPVFSGINDHSFNAYLFFSPEGGEDLITRICSSQSFSGLDVFAIGNGYLTNANISLKAGQIPNNSVSFIASNVIGQSLTGNSLQIPAINLESGTTGGAATMLLDPAQVCRISGQFESGTLLETWQSTFVPSFPDPQIPGQTLSSSVVNSIEIALSVDRENEYGFGSDHVFSRDVKFPIAGTISLNGIFTAQEGGDFASLMQSEENYEINLYNYDPIEKYLQGLSTEDISGVYKTVHLTSDSYLKIDNARLRQYSMKVGANGLLEFSNSFEFGATESGGYKYKQGEQNSVDSINFFSHEERRLVSRDGYNMSYDPFIYGLEGGEVVSFLSNDHKIMLVQNHVHSIGYNYLPTEPAPVVPSSVAEHAISAVDSRLALAGPTGSSISLYSSYDVASGISFTRNSSFWAADLDLTCISPWNSTEQNKRAGTAITKRHVIFATHYIPTVGDSIKFVTMDNTVVSRTISNVYSMSYTSYFYPDITIATLDSDLPDSITPCKFLPNDYRDYLPSSFNRIPALCLDQEEKGLVSDLAYLTYLSVTKEASFTTPVDSTRFSFFESIISGDSGNPSFIIVNNELVLITVWTFGGAGRGTLLAEFLTEISARIALDGAYTLDYADFSSFATV